MRIKTSLLVVSYITILLASITSLFAIKTKVIQQKKELKWINNQISQEKNNALILKAELAYLITPERINELHSKHLDLKIIDEKCIEDFKKR
jgi:cell division protein FtsL